MPRKNNFLLGRGERLIEDIVMRPSGGPKQHPYTVHEAKLRLAPLLERAVENIDALPDDACPRDRAVISLTLNPEYIAKSYFPTDLLGEVGIQVVGSRSRKIKPEKHSRYSEPEEMPSTELFAWGARKDLRKWSKNLPDWGENRGSARQLRSIETITAPSPREKIKGDLSERDLLAMEVVLHAGTQDRGGSIVEEFLDFLKAREISQKPRQRFYAQGLCFLGIDAPSERVEEIATFSMVRAVRRIPRLRRMDPMLRSSRTPDATVKLPDAAPMCKKTKVAIFDGGIPENHPLTKWVHLDEHFSNMGPATEALHEHGVAVTSAALFGHIDSQDPLLPRPFTEIDHYRVLAEESGKEAHELHDVLERIKEVLEGRTYDFINLSFGPDKPIEDDEVDAWTAVLDDRLARSSTLAIIAVGNTGESDAAAGLNRVLVPADCVNALAVGACDTTRWDWQRAPYSSIGPGRSCGRVKPDVVSFGGVNSRPFVALGSGSDLELVNTSGTSFAAPSVARMASGIRAHFGASLGHLAIRALLVHSAENRNFDLNETGWGRCAQELDAIVLCDDNEICIVYQDEIFPKRYVRALIPVPANGIDGKVTLKATICYKSQIDPHHPGNYTRAGLEVTFRPHAGRFQRANQKHADSKPFFGSSVLGATEHDLRRKAWKWETCLHAHKSMRGTSLQKPVFDIHYIARAESKASVSPSGLPYTLVVSIKAERHVDLYNQIVREYANRLEQLKPILDIPIHAKT